MTLNDAIAAAVQKYMDRYSSLPINSGIWSAMRYIFEEVLLLVSRDTLPSDVGTAIDHIVEVGAAAEVYENGAFLLRLEPNPCACACEIK